MKFDPIEAKIGSYVVQIYLILSRKYNQKLILKQKSCITKVEYNIKITIKRKRRRAFKA